MKREKIDVLRDEIHIPDVVMNAAEDAFSKIKLEASASQKQNTAEVKMMKKPVGFKKKWIAIAMVAVLAIGTLSVGAAKSDDWNWSLLKQAGVKESAALETIQIEDGYAEINVSDTSEVKDFLADPKGEKKQVTVTATESFGDNNHIDVRIETDYELPEGFDVDAYNYFVGGHFVDAVDVDGKVNKEEQATISPLSGASIRGVVEEGKLVLQMEMDGVDLNVCQINMELENFYIYSNSPIPKEPEELPDFYNNLPTDEDGMLKVICEGKWSLSWKYDYMEKEVVYKVDETLNIKGAKVNVSEVVVSPISISIRGEIDKESVKALVTEDEWNTSIEEFKKEHSELNLSQEEIEEAVMGNILHENRAEIKLYKINYKDGSFIEPYTGFPLDSVWNEVLMDVEIVMATGGGVDMDNIHSIILNGGEGESNTIHKKEIILK